jgi:hypothetical protein
VRESQAIIERIRLINSAIQHVELAVDPEFTHLKPGQSLLVRPAQSGAATALAERWWPVGIKPGHRLVIETSSAQRLVPQQILPIMGPIGEPFRYHRSLRNVLFVARDTSPAPLMMALTWLLERDAQVTLALLGAARDYDTRHLPATLEVIRGGDGWEWEGQVMSLGWADQVFVVADPAREGTLFREFRRLLEERRQGVPKSHAFAVFQPPLPCGAGACQGCAVRLKRGVAYACTAGPAFDITELAGD